MRVGHVYNYTFKIVIMIFFRYVWIYLFNHIFLITLYIIIVYERKKIKLYICKLSLENNKKN